MADLSGLSAAASQGKVLTDPGSALAGIENGDGVDITNRVVDSGSNPDGQWVRFADGIQICTRQRSIDDSAGYSASGSVYVCDASIAAAPVPELFNTVFYRGVNVTKSGGSGWSEPIFPFEVDVSAINQFYQVKFALARSITAGARIWQTHQIMIGTWK